MARVSMYSTHTCGYCRMALRLLDKKGVEVEIIHVDEHPERRREMIERTGRTSVPQIFIDDHHVGGYTDLAELDMDGDLDEMLAA